jgi:hypothetical protein
MLAIEVLVSRNLETRTERVSYAVTIMRGPRGRAKRTEHASGYAKFFNSSHIAFSFLMTC